MFVRPPRPPVAVPKCYNGSELGPANRRDRMCRTFTPDASRDAWARDRHVGAGGSVAQFGERTHTCITISTGSVFPPLIGLPARGFDIPQRRGYK